MPLSSFKFTLLGVGLVATQCFGPLLRNAGAQVTAGDTFNVAVVGFTSTGTSTDLVSSVDAIYGTTETFTNVAVDSQIVTIKSSTTTNQNSITTNTFTISVPINFDPSTTIEGTNLTSIEVDIGGYNAGSDTVDLIGALDPASLNLFGHAKSVLLTTPLSPIDTLSDDNASLALSETVTAGGLPATDYTSFVLAVSYDTIPEPTPEPGDVALFAAGGSALLFLIRSRQTKA